MKKIVLCLLITTAVFTAAVPSKAADITVGATTWYTYWKMTPGNTDKVDPTFLYGPVIAVKFNDDFVLNSVFLYGAFDDKNSGGMGTYTIPIDRSDSDTSLGYRLNGYLKIFAGFKFMRYEISYPAAMIGYSAKETVASYGPALGLSGIFPLGNNFFMLTNVSGLYVWTSNSFTGFATRNYNDYGYNITASVAYYIVPASVTLSLGGRYQYLTGTDDNAITEGGIKTNKFYGLTAAAIYTFSI